MTLRVLLTPQAWWCIFSGVEKPTQLSPADWPDVFLDQGAQVHRDEEKRGACNVDQHVERGQLTEIDAFERLWGARDPEGSAAPYNESLTNLMKGREHRPADPPTEELRFGTAISQCCCDKLQSHDYQRKPCLVARDESKHEALSIQFYPGNGQSRLCS